MCWVFVFAQSFMTFVVRIGYRFTTRLYPILPMKVVPGTGYLNNALYPILLLQQRSNLNNNLCLVPSSEMMGTCILPLNTLCWGYGVHTNIPIMNINDFGIEAEKRAKRVEAVKSFATLILFFIVFPIAIKLIAK
jgi:hypothetical protein